jgi:glycosyltransferase involved in cell wall biosynthesis
VSAFPQIATLASGVARPLVSVVIPTYEPQPFLIKTVRSLLAQNLPAEQMQIAIVDDASPTVRAEDVLADIAPPGRIEFHRHTERLGLAGNWNRAVQLARGEFVHILHQDDTINPGFYAALLAGLRDRPSVGMAFCRHAFIDENDRVERISHRERWRAGVLARWLERIAERQRIQCPATIVRRSVYETLGGFRSDLRYTLDWEMWVRIAARYDVWYEPKVLASYRRHGGAETARLSAAGATMADTFAAIEVICAHAPAARRDGFRQRAYRRLANVHARRAAKLCKSGAGESAAQQLSGARTAIERLPEGWSKRVWRHRLLRLERRLAATNR